jgi:hypothetical protein
MERAVLTPLTTQHLKLAKQQMSLLAMQEIRFPLIYIPGLPTVPYPFKEESQGT